MIAPGPWTSDPITGWVRDAAGKEIFRPMGVSTELSAVLLATPDMADALKALMGAAESFKAQWGIQSLTPAAARAIERAAAALAKAGL